MNPLFHIEDEVGLDAPPVGQLGPGEALGAPVPAPGGAAAPAQSCPNCGCQDPVVQQANAASVVCPVCQCQYGAPQAVGVETALPMESSVQRILGRVFERHARRQHYALKRVVGRPLSVSQHQPKLSGGQ